MNYIITDPSEHRHLPRELMDVSFYLDGLETETGADFVITPSKIPVTLNTLKIHIGKGISVQRKDVGDLVSSLQDRDSRLWRQLIRLLHTCAYPLLLIIGDLKAKNDVNDRGESEVYAVVDGRETKMPYFAIMGAIISWQEHGGYVEWISRDTLLPRWCQWKYNRLVAKEKAGGWRPTLIARQPIKPLELLSAVETTLLTFPGVGAERAKAIYEFTSQYILSPNITDCVRVVREHKIEGVGKDTKDKIVKYFGWTNGDK